MYLDHFQLKASPFAEEVDPAIFFPGAGRKTTCLALEKDISAGRLFIKLTGAEGTGKTLLCRVLQQRLGDDFLFVCLDNPKGAFDDVLRLMCLDLGSSAFDEGVSLIAELKGHLQRLKKEGRRVIFVFDGAEHIFLATLERLLRLLCELEEFANCTLLLAGRSALDANLEQLTVYCSGVDIKNGYTLEPFNEEETGRYLLYRLRAAGSGKDQGGELFVSEAVRSIFAQAGGNPRMTNILAEEALRRSFDDKSFMVLLDHVDATDDGTGIEQKKKDVLEFVQRHKKVVALGGGALLLLFVLLLFWPHGSRTPGEASPPVPVVTAPEVEHPVVGQESGEAGKTVVEKKKEAGAASAPILAGKETTSLEENAPAQGARKKTLIRPLIVAEKHKRAVGVRGQNGPAVGKEGKKEGDAGEDLYQERLRASASWLAGAYRGEYTIQLMMLTSAGAAENVKKLFLQDGYKNIIDKLYILRKQTSPPTLFVFYGTFASMDDARQARNQMPIFLRKHHPYALSIADALTKTED